MALKKRNRHFIEAVVTRWPPNNIQT